MRKRLTELLRAGLQWGRPSHAIGVRIYDSKPHSLGAGQAQRAPVTGLQRASQALPYSLPKSPFTRVRRRRLNGNGLVEVVEPYDRALPDASLLGGPSIPFWRGVKTFHLTYQEVILSNPALNLHHPPTHQL